MLSSLLRKTQRVIWMCCGVGVVAHLWLTQIGISKAEQGPAKPLTTRFVKRQPRLTKPLELKKRPQPKRRLTQRQMVAAKARTRGGEGGIRLRPTTMLRGLARPRAEVSRLSAVGGEEMEPQSFAGSIEGSREPKHKIDMSLELLDISALNTGRYHALVVQDPTDKQNITGFLNLAYIYSTEMEGLGTYRSADMTLYGVTRLVEKMNDWTQIKTKIAGRFTFDSSELFETPWVYTRAGHSLATWVIPQSDAQNLGRYLRAGGFWIADGLQDSTTKPGSGQDIPMRNAVRDAMATVDHKYGRDWDFQVLPFEHPIFHCFFEFCHGAPISADSHKPFPVEGVFMAERLSVMYTRKNLVYGWVMSSPVYPEYVGDGTRVFQFGVNTIVFALTQEGSITHRLTSGME